MSNSRQLPEYFGILRRPQVIEKKKKIPPLYLRKKFTGYCREFKGK